MTGASMSEPVRHRGELLGALSIEKRPGETLTATEEKLVRDLAAQAGLVMRNAGLTEELMDTIAQLRTSRQRLVTAQDEERRKLERNLHDGAQQRIVALTVSSVSLERLVERDPAQARSIAGQLREDATDALEELRDLARGIYPPLLADQGLIAALRAQARKSVVPVTVEGDGIGRYAREAEAAVYFSCLEALQNVAKYASASRAAVSLSDGDGSYGSTSPTTVSGSTRRHRRMGQGSRGSPIASLRSAARSRSGRPRAPAPPWKGSSRSATVLARVASRTCLVRLDDDRRRRPFPQHQKKTPQSCSSHDFDAPSDF